LLFVIGVISLRKILEFVAAGLGQPGYAIKKKSPPTLDPNAEPTVLIVGGGIGGIAAAGALNAVGIDNLVLERSPHTAHSWRNHYHRLHLHTASMYSNLPYLKYPSHFPLYVSRQQVVDYVTGYAVIMGVKIKYNQSVLNIDRDKDGWIVESVDLGDNTKKIYKPKFVVIATGRNIDPIIPVFKDQEKFKGTLLHSSVFKSAEHFRGKSALIVGFGNTGGELAIDFWERDCKTHVIIRSPLNIVSRDSVLLSAVVGRYLPNSVVKIVERSQMKLKYGNLGKFGITCPHPHHTAVEHLVKNRVPPAIDIGQIDLIRKGDVKVITHEIERFVANGVVFKNGQEEAYDVVVLATGYASNLSKILSSRVYGAIIDDKGFPKEGKSIPSNYEGIYCVGFTDLFGRIFSMQNESIRIAAEVKRKLKV